MRLHRGAAQIVRGDAWLLCAVVSGGVGNASGGLIARKMGGWQTICWGLVVVAPITFAAVLHDSAQLVLHAALQAWLSLLYLGLVSSLLAFCAWVKGLAIGGIARVGQLQLLQPFAILVCSAILTRPAHSRSQISTACAALWKAPASGRSRSLHVTSRLEAATSIRCWRFVRGSELWARFFGKDLSSGLRRYRQCDPR
jgi:drug/metabolite transporter (DMT)-like permease